MKLLIVATLAALASPPLSGRAGAATSSQLLQSCQAVLDAAGPSESDTVEIPADGLACWDYMAAVQDMSVVVDQHGRHLLGICAPEDTTLMQYVRIFTRYARRQPSPNDENVGALALRALLDAFPCGVRQPT